MKTLWRNLIQQRKVWLPAMLSLALFCRTAAAQSLAVSDYPSFVNALTNNSASNSVVITNFSASATILLTNGQTINITSNTLIDGGFNDVVFNGSNLARIFYVQTNCQLILKNVQVLNGVSTNGGGIYSEGALIISNAIFFGNAATNFSGSTNGSGNGGNGGMAVGGAIYSLGPVSIYYSAIENNAALGGNGGNGGAGVALVGSGGSGGSAYGAAIYSTGSSNMFFATEFLSNTCAAGSGGSGYPGPGLPDEPGGEGAAGGSAAGGAVYVAGSLYVSNCVFAENIVIGGASGTDATGTNNGFDGGLAAGGGLCIASAVTDAYIENTVFFGNACTGGAGGSATNGNVNGGNGGSAAGGGLDSFASLTLLGNCTLATNTLAGGAYGTGTVAYGTYGVTTGGDICGSAGAVMLYGSILSGGTSPPALPQPIAAGVTDAGFNISSDSSLTRALTNTLENKNPLLGSASTSGGPTLGPVGVAGPAMLTLPILSGSPAAGYVPGVPGLTFPAYDERLAARGSPTSAGAFEINPIQIAASPRPPTIAVEPTNVLTGSGSTATFQVSAVSTDANNPSLGYQWQLDGTNLPDNDVFIGATSDSLTVKDANGLYQGTSYQVIVSVSMLEGYTSSSSVSLLITNAPKISVQPVHKRSVPYGSVVSFSVTTRGGLPSSYQWRLDGTNLMDANEITNSATSNLMINPALFRDEGSYTIVVTNFWGGVTSSPAILTVTADTARPTVTISSPPANARTNNGVISGKAKDNAQVATVYCWITNVNNGNIVAIYTNGVYAYSWSSNVNNGNITNTNGTAALILGTNGATTKTWTIGPLLPGTNHVTVQSVDYASNKSSFVRREFFYVSTAPLTLITNGPGRVSGKASIAHDVAPTNNGALLNIGEGYMLTAIPGVNFVLTNWTVTTNGTVTTNTTVTNAAKPFTTNSLTLHFIMESNLVITANFTTNLFIGAEGAYNGLFYPTNAAGDPEITEETSGMLSGLTLRSSGAYNGRLLLGGASYNLTGAFSTSGYASNYLKRPAAKGGPLAVQMTLLWTNGVIDGSVSPGNTNLWVSTFHAFKSAVESTDAQYTVLLGSGTNFAGEIPPGFGYALIADRNGSVTLSGALADGATYSQNVPVGLSNDAPVLPVYYGKLYKNTGLILGWLNFSNGNVHAEQPMVWIKPAVGSGIYPAGFTNDQSVFASGWTNLPAQTPAVTLASGPLIVSNTSLDLDFNISLTDNTIAVNGNEPTNSLTGAIMPKTGLFQIVFDNGTGKTTKGYGVILQGSTNGGGYFVTTTNAGAILLNTPP